MSSWQPDPTIHGQLRDILSGTLSPSKFERDRANEALEQAKVQKDLDNYLLFTLTQDFEASAEIRASAGLMLKNNVLKDDFARTRPKQVQEYIINNVLKGLLDNEVLVRNITGNVITALFQIYGVTEWPQVLVQLMELTNGEQKNSVTSQEGAISALSKICEDHKTSLEHNLNGQVPSEFLIPNFINLLGHASNVVIAQSINCLNNFIAIKSQGIQSRYDLLLGKFFELTGNSDANVRKNLCISFCLILNNEPQFLMPHVEGITNYCLHVINETSNPNSPLYDEEVALEACEFLLGLATYSYDITSLLPNIIPMLVEKMVYSTSNIEYYENIDSIDDTEIEDRDEDIKPVNAKSREKTVKSIKNGDSVDGSKVNGKSNGVNGYEHTFDEDEDDDDDGDDDDDEIINWNLRKCSAATLDLLANSVPKETIALVLPVLKDRIISDNWAIREAAILAFGAISDGCINLEADKMPTLVPFLVDRLQDKSPRVRQITCWTLGRYSPWVCQEAHKDGQYANYFIPTLQAIMACALDSKKIVQESASSALAKFITKSDYELTANLVEPLLEHFNKCFKRYKRKNLVILYDAVQTFVDKVGDIISSKKEYIELLLVPLLEKWEQLPDNDKDLWPLLECMSSVAASLGELFAPYAVSTYQRAIRILASCINLDKISQADPTIDSLEKDFIVTSVDLIDGLVQGLGAHSADLVLQNSKTANLIDLLLICFQDPTHEVRQSSFALLGDLCIFVMRPIVLPYLHPLMEFIIYEINRRSYDSSPVCNNATWTLGEMSLVLTNEEMKPYLNDIIKSLISLINSTDCEQTVLENAAITLGRLGFHNSQELSQHLGKFTFAWCKYMKYLEDNEEKESAFKGMCNIVACNPTGLGETDEEKRTCLLLFIDCMASYYRPGLELSSIFDKLILGYKEILGSDWSNLINSLDLDIQHVLVTKYGN